MLMVVSELAKHPVVTAMKDSVVKSCTLRSKLKPLVWCCALATGLVTWGAQADIVADKSAPGGQQPTIISGANGTPQINIQSPNKNGVSHNKYQQFDVDSKGAILNNSSVNTQTQLGGMITSNPWLAKGEASVILNEVNSSNPSRLNGFVEVAGKRADVIIANPAGITCNGCGFINANKTTLAAAQVLLEQGKIAGFQVKNGQIAIQGNGMNDTQSDYTQLIARAVKINARLHAKDLSVTVGENRTDARGNVIATASTSGKTEDFSIDVASLGGMYANKIKLVGTETGVGVRNAGNIGAQAGDFTLSADGKLQNTGVITAQNVNVASQQSIENSGSVLAQQSLTLDAKGAINNHDKGQIIAGRDATLRGETLHNDATSLLAAGVDEKGRQTSAGSLNAEAKKGATLQGQLAAKDALRVTGSELDLSALSAQATDVTLTASESGLNTRDAHIQAAQKASLSANGDIDNQRGNIAASELSLSATGEINNTGGRLVSQGDLSINSQSLTNNDGVVAGQSQVNLRTKSLDNRQGWVKANGELTITSDAIDNRETLQTGLGLEGQSVMLDTTGLNNQSGAVRGAQTINATVSDSLNNDNGMLSAGTQLAVTDTPQKPALKLSNEQGVMVSNGSLDVTASQLSGTGKLVAQKDLNLTLGQDFNNTGHIQAGENLAIHLTQGLTNSGLISGLGDVALAADTLINTVTGEISSGKNTAITTTHSLHNTGLVDGVNTLLRGAVLNNLGTGRIYGDVLTLAFDTLLNDKQGDKSAVIAGRQSVNIAVADLTNRDHALIYSDGDLAIGGSLDDASVVTGRAGSVKNHSANIESGGNLSLKTSLLENKDIHLQLSDDVQQVSREHFEWFDSGNGRRYRLQARNGNNDRYAINDDGTLNHSVKIGYESSNRWRMFENGDVTKDFYQYVYDSITYETQVIHQDAALITSGKNLTLDGEQLNNDNAHIVAGQNLAVTGSTLNNTEAQGVRRTVDVGQTHYLHKGGGKWSTRDTVSAYQGANKEEKLALNLMSVRGSAGEINKTTIEPSSAREPEAIIGGEGFDGSAIKTTKPTLTLPDNSLFTLNPDSNSHYLVETDPRFTNEKKWLSSLDIVDSDKLEKRLGDGYYEQRLVREQLIATTGQRLSGSYQNDEEQYAALLNAGVAFGDKYHLTPGIALSNEQMAALTTDIVWMVNETITLPDGRVEKVSVPQVYVRAVQGDLGGQGALLAGRQVSADLAGALLNSGEVSSRAMTDLSADTIENSGRIQGIDIALDAQKDIHNIGGEIRGVDSVSLNAGRDIVSETEQRRKGSSAWLDRPASIYVTGDQGQLTLAARQNVNLIASDIGNSGEKGKTLISAGQNIQLETRDVASAFDYTANANNYYRGATSSQVGTAIHTQGDLTLSAGQDLLATAASVDSGGQLTANAGRDVSITAGVETEDYIKHTKHTDKGLLSSKTKETHDEIHSRTALSSTFTGDSLDLTAGHDVNLNGSNVTGTNAVNVTAGNNLNIGTVDEALHESHMSKTTKSGLMSSGGIGFSVGKQSIKQTNDTESNQKKGSVVGSSADNVTLTAGNTVAVNGSDVIAARDITVTGKEIHVTAAENTRTDISTTETKQSGLTLSLSGAVGSALNTTYQTARAAHDTDDGQLKALQGIKAGLNLEQANQARELAAAKKPGSDMSNNDSFGINLSYGSNSSKSVTKTQQKTASGSALTAGDNLTLKATGQGEQGNIVVQGSQLQAGKDLTLDATNNLLLTSANNSQTVDGKNSSKGSSVGVGITAGSGGFGWNVNASASKGSGFEKGNSQYYTDTQVNAGKTLTLNSGHDTTLAGAQASGETVKATVGGNLTLSSQQATDAYDSKQKNVSVSGSAGMGNGSFSASASKTAMRSDYQSVDKQTGINAGQGGFDITVGEHTQLNGAVISSQADKEKNRLDTGTLGFNDIRNHADYKVEQQSVGINSGGPIAGQLITNSASALLSGVNNSGQSSNTTHAAVSDGQIIVRDTGNQKQDINDLSRDTANAHEKLETIFDKDAEQKRIDRNQLIGEVGQQIADIAATQAEIAATRKVNKDWETPSEAERDAAKQELTKAGQATDDVATIDGYIKNQAIQAEINQSQWGVGGDNRRIVEAGTALIQGLANGDVSRAVANASAPYLANEIAKNIPKSNQSGRLAAHAIANVALALVKGENALSQAAGAVTAEAIGMLSGEIYGKDVSHLTEDEKTTLSAFASLAAGLAGGLAGGSTQDALNAGQAGKTTVENNYLGQGHPQEYADKYNACNGNVSCEQNIRKDMAQESAENIQKLKSCWDAGDAACVADTRSKIELDEKAYTKLRQQDNMVGRTYEDSAKWYADIIDQCAGKCDWLEASLLKTGADGLGNLVYGALGAGSLPKPGQTVSANDLKVAGEISKDIASVGKQTDIGFAAKQTKKSAGQIVIKNIKQSEAIENLSANGYIKSVSKDGSVTVMTKDEKVYRFYPSSTGGGIAGAESGVPSASVSVNGKIISKLRFPGE